MHCIPPCSSVHAISQARVLKWVAISFPPRIFTTQGWNSHFLHWQADSVPRETTQMANRHMKRCSTLLVTRDIQIKTTVRYHLTPIRMAIIKKSKDNKCWRGCGEKAARLHCWWECKLVQPLWRTVWRFLRKVKTELPYDSNKMF